MPTGRGCALDDARPAACRQFLTRPPSARASAPIRPGVQAREIEPWSEAGQTWRRLHVRFPPEIATHNPDQAFYFDTLGMQRRMDYITEVNGSTLVGHYSSRYMDFGGLLVATRRRVFRRNPDNTVNLNLPSISLDIRDVELVRSGGQQAPP